METRNHFPGGEWLYLKIYGGHKTLERALVEKLWPLNAEFLDKGLARLWFFVRYTDPDLHLRYRLRLNENACDEGLIRAVREALEPFLSQGLIWRVEVATYRREMERYGCHTMEFAEQLFFHDSRACLDFLRGEADPVGDTRWLYALASADACLCDFGYDLQARKEIMMRLNRGYGTEFGKDGTLAGQISERFRSYRDMIQETLDRTSHHPISAILSKRSEANADPVESIRKTYTSGAKVPDMDDLVSSIIHMSMNRIFPLNNRLHEMVIYDLLFRHYKSTLARTGNIVG